MEMKYDEQVFSTLRVLIACEESQTECLASRRLGAEAFSCDIEPCSGGHPEWHIQDDVRSHLAGWDLIIGHPPLKVVGLPPQTQAIQPYQFGEPWSKLTYLWLRGLPNLEPTKILSYASGVTIDATLDGVVHLSLIIPNVYTKK